MKETELESLMAAYKDSLGACSKKPTQLGHQRRWGRLTAFAACAGVVTLGGFLVWPRDAAAATMHRITTAISNVKSMQMTYSMKSIRTGQWKDFSHAYWQDNKWRVSSFEDSPIEVTFVIRDGRALENYTRLDHAVLEPCDKDYFEQANLGNLSALEYVEQTIDMGSVDEPRKVTVHPYEPVNGVPTYEVTLDRARDGYHASIVVDSKTDLPISTEISWRNDGRAFEYRQSYRFNQSLSEELFTLTPGKPVVNILDAERDLTSAWAKPLGGVKGAEIRDASVSRDGTVWIAVSADSPEDDGLLPSVISTPDGGIYSRIMDINPSQILLKSRRYQFNEHAVHIVGFVPIDTNAKRPTVASVTFGRRNAEKGDDPGRPLLSPAVTVALRRDMGERPDYFVTLDLDHFGFQIPKIIWDERAITLAKLGRSAEAARAYEGEAAADAGFIPRKAADALKQAAEQYKKAGMQADADRVLAEANRIK